MVSYLKHSTGYGPKAGIARRMEQILHLLVAPQNTVAEITVVEAMLGGARLPPSPMASM